MKRITLLMGPLLLAFVVFHLWHTPLKGPLTDAEIEAFFASQPETGGTVWTDHEAFEDFLRSDDGRPFVMINLMELRDVPDYPDGFTQDETTTGKAADKAYGQAVLPLLLQRGSYPVARAERYHTLINSLGQTAGTFDSLAMVRYRSRRDLIDMISSEPFLAAEVHKWASLENTLVAPARNMPSFRIIGWTPLFLFIGAAAMIAHIALRKRAGSA
jgi:hypothetical protein